MSAPPAEDWMVLSWLKFPNSTPPLELVVHRVIGPPDVPKSLGAAALVPLLELIRPADLMRIPPLPAAMLAFSEVVAVPRASKETRLPAVTVEPTVMFAAEERDTLVCAVRAADVVKAPAEEVIDMAPPDESTAAVLLVNAPEPESVIFPAALMAAVGEIEEPPLMVTAPSVEVIAPAPAYEVLG
jgi:hypothetical protein